MASESGEIQFICRPDFMCARQNRQQKFILNTSIPKENLVPFAIVMHAPGGPDVLKFEEVSVPQPQSHEVVVRHTAIAVNFHDAYVRSGAYKTLELPGVPGIEAAGVVEAVGADVIDFRPGDRVAYVTKSYGAYAEKRVISQESLVLLPPNVSDEVGAAIFLKGLTAQVLIEQVYRVKKGDWVLVHAAAGGVGLLLCQWARHLGARVIGTASSQEKADLAPSAGADEVIVFTQQDFGPEVKRLTDGKGVDVVYDGVGKATFEKNLDVMRLRGMLVLYGMSSGPVPPVDPAKLSEKGSLYMARTTLAHFTATREELRARSGALFEMIANGKLKLRIAKTYSLAEAAQAHRDMEARKIAGKLLLIP